MIVKNQIFTFTFNSENLIVNDEKGQKIVSFFYNMKGYIPEFELSNNRNVIYNFQERGKTIQIKEFKKAIKTGFVNLKKY